MGLSPALTEVGILGMSVHIPRTAVSQADLETHDKASPGKYTIGLGQAKMSFVTDREDVISLSLTAVDDLMRSSGLSYAQIGRLEVGTETILDKSKSIKTSLMQLFRNSGNSDVEGLDCTNACYGATAALFNAFAWMESSFWDGRFAIVVAADIAVYAPGPARPTGGAAAVAMLIGRHPSAAVRFEVGLRATCMGDSYDFFKPRLSVEYPTVKGQETVDTFVRAMDECYKRFRVRASAKDGAPFTVAESTDFALFHAPFNKMVQKAFARLMYNDFLTTEPGSDPFYANVEQYRDLPHENSHQHRAALKAFVQLSKPLFEKKCAPGAWLGVEIGNCYTASLYSSLAALIYKKRNAVVGKRILMYSFGSGFASSMFSMRVSAPVDKICRGLRLRERLDDRVVVEPAKYEATLTRREKDYCRFDYEPEEEVDNLFPGTFYLKAVLREGEREYGQVPFR